MTGMFYTLETNKYGDQAWVERLDDQVLGAGTLVRVRLLTEYQAWQPSVTDTDADVVDFLNEDTDAANEAEGWGPV